MSRPEVVRLCVNDLSWLHDAPLTAMTWRVAAEGGDRDDILSLEVPDYSEGPFVPYRGRAVEIVFADTSEVRFSGVGNVANSENFDGADLRRTYDSGRVAVGMCFSSGSELSLICDKVELVVG